jgi:gamma-tubulin complex component 3
MQYYMMFEVLECSWSTLVNDMQTIRDVDSLIAAHNRYVDGILEGALLNQVA